MCFPVLIFKDLTPLHLFYTTKMLQKMLKSLRDPNQFNTNMRVDNMAKNLKATECIWNWREKPPNIKMAASSRRRRALIQCIIMLFIASVLVFSFHHLIIGVIVYSMASLTPTQGGQKMEIKEAGKLWLEYHRFNSQKKYGKVI